MSVFKGTASRDFLPPVFSIRVFLLVPKDMTRNDFDLKKIFEDLFDYFGASPVSTTQAKQTKQALPVSLRPVRNSSPVSTTQVNYAFSILEYFTGVNDAAEELHHQCQYLTSPVSDKFGICYCKFSS